MSTDFFLLRTPALSYACIYPLNACTNQEEVEVALRNFYQSKHAQSAIFLASPILFHQLKKWLKSENSQLNDRKLLIALYKYAIRMCSRATPFGMFSGVSLGLTNLMPSSIIRNDAHLVRRKLSGRSEDAILQAFTLHPDYKTKGTLQTNNTLYPFMNGYRYYEYLEQEHGNKKYVLSFIESSPYLDYLLKEAKLGVGYEELVQGLAAMEIPVAVAIEYIDRIIAEQVLTSDLQVNTSDTLVFDKMLAKTNRYSPSKDNKWWNFASKGKHILKSSPTIEAGQKLLTQHIEQNLSLSLKGNSIQADMKIGTDVNRINSSVINLLTEEVESLAGLFKTPLPEDLNLFKTRFVKRYESREVPLLEALDNDIGIGYGNSSDAFWLASSGFEELSTRIKPQGESSSDIVVNEFVLDLYAEYLTNSQQEIVINEEAIRAASDNNKREINSSYYLLGSLVAKNSNELDRGQFKFVLSSCSGPSSIPLMTRFCETEPKLKTKLKECIEKEMGAYDGILASIVHVPDSTLSGVVQRPPLRQYEIPIISVGSPNESYQIPMNDLLVSVVDNRIVLRSKKLNRRIVPRQDCAHNHATGMGLYRFLCDLQYQEDHIFVNWDWGELRSKPFLPRVVYKHIILARARWRISQAELQQLEDTIRSKECFLKKHKLPLQVMLVEGDNELLIDFQSLFGFEILISALKKGDVVLTEPACAEGKHLVHDRHNRPYANEILVPVNRPLRTEASKFPLCYRKQKLVQRTFSTASEWVYLKVYCGVGTADLILRERLPLILKALSKKNTLRHWFFVRYTDSDYHLRIRFNLAEDDGNKLGYLIKTIHNNLDDFLQKGYIHRLQFDTYCREIERYGYEFIELTERLFHVDSEFTVKMLTRRTMTDFDRLLIAMLGMDQLLDSFELCEFEKLKFVETMRGVFGKEQSPDGKLKYKFDKSFRANRRKIESVFMTPLSPSHQHLPWEPLRLRGEQLSVLFKAFKSTESLDSGRKLALLESYCHMFQNRIYLCRPRFQEALAYHYLVKYYRSVVNKPLR